MIVAGSPENICLDVEAPCFVPPSGPRGPLHPCDVLLFLLMGWVYIYASFGATGVGIRAVATTPRAK